MDAPKRLREISGYTTTDPPFTNATLDFPLNMLSLARAVPIRDVMNITGDTLCYKYV